MKILTKARYYLLLIISIALSIGCNTYANENVKWNSILRAEEFDIESIKIITDSINGESSVSMNMDGMSIDYRLGYPNLPIRIIKMEVPLFSNQFTVKVCNVEKGKAISLGGKIPFIDNRISGASNLSEENTVIDNIDRCQVSISNEYLEDGNRHFVIVVVSPFIYNEDNNILETVSSLSFELIYNKCDESQMSSVPLDYYDEDFETYKIDEPGNSELSKSALTRLNYNYYIITPSNLKSSLEPLIVLKRQKGFNVNVVTTEELLYKYNNNKEYKDFEEFTRNWLISEYKQKGKFYLLFIGDSKTNTPLRKFRVSSSNSEYDKLYNGGNYIPSDTYFSDLTSKYSLEIQPDGIHYSTMVDDVMCSPLLPVGRLLANKGVQIDNYVHKLLIYEVNPGLGNNDYLDKLLVTQQEQHLNYTSLLDVLDFKNKKMIQDNCANNFANNLPTGEQIIKEMSTSGLISLQGHGCPTMIACSGINDYGWRWRYIQPIKSYDATKLLVPSTHHIDTENGLDLLDNINKPSVIYTLSCDVAPFDIYQKNIDEAYDAEYNMASAYTTAGLFGGVAFIGNTRLGYDYYNKPMELEFGKCVNQNKSVGDAFISSVKASSYKYAQYARTIIGDPEFTIWNGKPLDSNVTLVKNSISRIYIQSEGLINGKVVFFDGEDNQVSYLNIGNSTGYTFNYSDIFGSSVSALEGVDYLVGVWTPNRLPFLDLIVSNKKLRTKKNYILGNIRLGNASSDPDKHYSVEAGGVLSLKCMGDLNSSEGIVVNTGGIVNLNASGAINIDSDVINAGGAMNINAANVKFGSGFSVKKGGALKVN